MLAQSQIVSSELNRIGYAACAMDANHVKVWLDNRNVSTLEIQHELSNLFDMEFNVYKNTSSFVIVEI